MNAAVKAGVTYFGAVFLIGFVLGTIRVLSLVPSLGETVSVSLETPVMLAASWSASRWTVNRFHVLREVPARLLMGGVAFTLLMIAEFALAALLFGRSLEEHVTAYATLPGAIGLAAQLVFAAFPLVQRMQRLIGVMA